jgi:hypothetical protein
MVENASAHESRTHNRRLSKAVGVYAAPDQDVYGADIWLNGVHAVATCSAPGKVGPDSRLTLRTGNRARVAHYK